MKQSKEVLDRETRNYDFTDDPILYANYTAKDTFAQPLADGTVLDFYPERREKAYEFIKNSNERPEYYPDPPGEPTLTSAGGLYGARGLGGPNNIGCDQWQSHNFGNAYGSMTAAGLWSLYCVNKGWNLFNPNLNPVAWNEMLWLKNNYTVDYNPNMGAKQKWYYYYVMTMTKAMLMNSVPQDHFTPGGDWYMDFANELTQITGGANHKYQMSEPKPVYGQLCHWKNPSAIEDPEERDVFCTVSAVLGLETKITSQYANRGDKIIIVLLSPADLLVYDEGNKKTGCENGNAYTEIPMSTYTGCGTEPQVIEIGGAGGTYRIKVKATGDGYVKLKVRSQYQGYDISEYGTGVTVTAGAEYEYRVSVGNVHWPMTLSCDFAKRIETPEVTVTITPTMTATTTITKTATATITESITRTMTKTQTITPTPQMVNVVLKYKSAQVKIITNDPKPWFRVYNSGSNEIDLRKIEIRYWYRYEGSGQLEQVWVDWAGRMPQGTYLTNLTNIGIIRGNYGRNQDRYIRITFREGAGMIGKGEYVEIQTRYNKVDWSNYDQSNDWSYVGYTEYTNWDKVGVYYEGVLIWGKEPGMGMLSKGIEEKEVEDIGEGNVYSYPNPSRGEVIIRFSLAKTEEVRVVIYDINGREVWGKEVEGRRGINNVIWEGRNEEGKEVGNGIYIYRVMTKEKRITKKIAIIR